MWDSLDLAAVIGDTWDAVKDRSNEAQDDSRHAWREALDPKLAAFEKVMQERGATFAKDSSDNGKMIFSDDALEKLVAFFKSIGPPEE
jgi:hypothetical protein